MAYATSGPGATNLVTGICNAYFDSIPVVFITGNVNTFEAKGNLQVRQRGFQETDIVKMVEHVTKYAVYVDSAEKLPKYLENAFRMAHGARQGMTVNARSTIMIVGCWRSNRYWMLVARE